MDGVRHAVTLAANSVHWALRPEQLALVHSGVLGHLTIVETHLRAAGALIDIQAQEES